MSHTTTVAAGLEPANDQQGSDRRAGVVPASAARARRRQRGNAADARSRSRPLLVGEVVLVAFLLFGYDRIASVANARESAAMRHGWALWRVGAVVHIAVALPPNGVLATPPVP